MQSYIKNIADNYVKISSVFVDRFMPSADGTFVKVYLLGLRQCSRGIALTTSGIASALNILESDVLRAWKYWEDAGVVKCGTNKDGSPSVIFLDLTDVQSQPAKTLPQKPGYSSAEITEYVNDHSEMKDLLHHAESALGKTLSSNDQSTIFGLHDWLGLPVEVIGLLISYCVSINKKSMRFIEMTAINWSEHEVDTLEKAEKYLTVLQENNSRISSYKRAIGIFDRVLTKPEMDFLSAWAFKLVSPVELVKLAAEITALNTGKISLPYMNTMLQEWYRKGIKTAADARAMRNEFKKQSGEIKNSTPSAKSQQGKFKDYTFRTDYDFGAIEQAALHFKKDTDKEA